MRRADQRKFHYIHKITKKWLKENNLKAGAKVVVRDQHGNITHRFERRS